jgi:tRNA A37 threonylcarbamoyladenosine dehydratase
MGNSVVVQPSDPARIALKRNNEVEKIALMKVGVVGVGRVGGAAALIWRCGIRVGR